MSSRYDDRSSSAQGEFMKRREFIGLIVGIAGAWPLSAQAQSKTYRIALLTLENGEAASQLIVPLRDLGYVEGKT